MRFPLAKSRGDTRPIADWEWLFAPVVVPFFLLALLVLGVVLTPYWWLYPERHMQLADGPDAPSEQKRELAAYREYRRRVGVFHRLLERLHVVPFDHPPSTPAA